MATPNGLPKSSAPPQRQPPPNQTLYITNLPDRKISKPDLRRALYMLFTTHGHVLDVVALRTQKMRGQAHIVYRDAATATQAMRSLQGVEIFGRKMVITYAKGKSSIISRLDGSATIAQPPAPHSLTQQQQAGATETQKTIFAAPPPAQHPLPPPPKLGTDEGVNGVPGEETAPKGVKRPREEDAEAEEVEKAENTEKGGVDEESDAPMEEDDEGSAMEESDDE